LADFFKSDKSIEAAAYLSIVQLSVYLHDAMKDVNPNLDPISPDAWENIYMDLEGGSAFVPLGNFAGAGSNFSLNFVVVDGQWVYSPYALVDSINAASKMNQDDSK
jgi:hypothetical protein